MKEVKLKGSYNTMGDNNPRHELSIDAHFMGDWYPIKQENRRLLVAVFYAYEIPDSWWLYEYYDYHNDSELKIDTLTVDGEEVDLQENFLKIRFENQGVLAGIDLFKANCHALIIEVIKKEKPKIPGLTLKF